MVQKGKINEIECYNNFGKYEVVYAGMAILMNPTSSSAKNYGSNNGNKSGHSK